MEMETPQGRTNHYFHRTKFFWTSWLPKIFYVVDKSSVLYFLIEMDKKHFILFWFSNIRYFV